MSESGRSEDTGVSPPRKCRRDNSESKQEETACIVHVPGLKEYTKFTAITTHKDPLRVLEKLKDIRDKRLAEPKNSVHRLESSCKLIPSEISSRHGYHR